MDCLPEMIFGRVRSGVNLYHLGFPPSSVPPSRDGHCLNATSRIRMNTYNCIPVHSLQGSRNAQQTWRVYQVAIPVTICIRHSWHGICRRRAQRPDSEAIVRC